MSRKMKHITWKDYRSSTKIVKCEKCKQELVQKDLAKNNFVCPKCGKYNKLPARVRIAELANKGSFKEFWPDVTTVNPINFPTYAEKYKAAQDKSGESDGVVTGTCRIGKTKVAIFVMEPKFMMASMGSVVGDKITALFEYATKKKLPVIGFTASGGARMQEGMVSLMQMAKVSGAVQYHSQAGLLYTVCCTDPTTGGITASFAMLGDIIIAEPEATIGFAGRRVVEQVTGETLPDDFQSSEFQFEKGFLDAIVKREDMRDYLVNLLKLHSGRR